ncbi:MAG TPA: hypothetical protein VGH54_11465 [Mycobacterium sp.]|uniref:hypothetical protein n=1 Tax=Mycobacterium sp. TaxID=1785 RepID=UPI002F40A5EE
MTRDELRAAVLEAVTFRGDEGTSGYLLGPEQVDAVMALTDAWADERMRELHGDPVEALAGASGQVPWYARALPADSGPPAQVIAALRLRVMHLGMALDGENEGVRLWMTDCGQLVEKHRAHAAELRERLREIAADWMAEASDAAVYATEPEGTYALTPAQLRWQAGVLFGHAKALMSEAGDPS